MGRPSIFPPEIQEYIAEHVTNISAKDLAEAINAEFGTSYTDVQVRRYKKTNGLKSGRHFGVRKWTIEMEEYIREVAVGRLNREVADLVNERFGEGTITESQVMSFKKNHNIKSGLKHRFKKGNIPYTKGKPLEEWMSPEGIKNSAKTRFKKGNIPNTRRPIGTITKARDGYLWIKVGEAGDKKFRSGWEQLQRHVWKQHNGEIPDDAMIIFLDGNKENCDINNLALVTRAEHIEMIRSGLRFKDSELTAAGIGVARLRTRTRELGRESNDTHRCNHSSGTQAAADQQEIREGSQ